MRAREFTINIPINIKINGDEDPEIEVSDNDEISSNFVPPLQQKIELMKHAAGKQGTIIDQIIADDDNELS
jgi:hypothetical protein